MASMGKTSTELDVEAELARFEAEERARLGIQADGATPDGRAHWTDSMIDPQFARSERAHTTILCGGLTMAHDYLVEGALRGLGYEVRALDCPDTESLRHGKEFGNRGQCNPTHFTVGNLVKELCRLRDEEGLSSEEVVKHYVFLTAGACGPCRFGMYVTEYRKALRDAGFDGFRVMLFQQTGGLKQATGEEAGLDLSPPFFIAIAKALLAGDVLNLMAYRIRPYEVEPGATDRAMQAAKDRVHTALSTGGGYVSALRGCRDDFAGVEVDRLRAKPKVAILGEFWAMTTEGDGNYHLQRFVEQEGGECDIQILTSLLLYNLWEIRHDTLLRAQLKGTDGGQFGLEGTDVGLKVGGLWLGELALRGVFHSLAALVGLRGYKLPDMDAIASVGDPHYDVSLRGGEGHLEVAKLILNVTHQKAHMTLSVKPFGCMPSSGVSDGVQSRITELHPQAIFCAVETSGDGAANFHSRVQMFLFKARQRAKEEFEKALADHGITLEEAQSFLRSPAGRRYRETLYKAPHVTAGTGADVIHEIAPLVGKSALGRARVHLRRGVARATELARKDLHHAAHLAREIAPYVPALSRRIALEIGEALPAAGAKWRDGMRDWLRPTEAQKQEIARAEEASRASRAPARIDRGAVSLPVVA